ncbi:hypothetical protein JTE90_000787 [Oedothorax gibbosus]|uniref:Uncharacterized protein n=1 Tax=Oedothorax gibbosus TaxID=931172 RepID=A0AAV6UAT7_9ARAC|nr:hypothetical protein JTE90_000787 [Oedothorax gibbosus]
MTVAAALRCFRCGKYTPDGAGSVIPCYTYNDTDIKECHKEDRYCLKYLNKGIIVRDCAYKCKPGIQDLSEFFCCNEDGCNTASTIERNGWTFLLALISMVFYLT